MRRPESDSVFENAVVEAFAFLRQSGFEVVEHGPTLVRYRHQNVEVDIYQGRRSFEIGAGVAIDGERFALSELVRLGDAKAADVIRNPTATDDEGVARGVSKVASWLRQFGLRALQGDATIGAELVAQRKALLEALELDALAEQIRPLAETAFRAADYLRAAELYSRIRSRLTPSEKGKLELAEVRSATRH